MQLRPAVLSGPKDTTVVSREANLTLWRNCPRKYCQSTTRRGELTAAIPGRGEPRALLGAGFCALSNAVALDRAYRIGCPLMIVCGTRDAAGFVKAYDAEWSGETGVPIS